MPSGSGSRVVFFGYGEFAVAGIAALEIAGAQIVAVAVPSNRSGPDVDCVRAVAAGRNLPVWVQPPRRDVGSFAERLRSISPDVLIVWSHSMLLPNALLDVPPRGAVNVHGGLLPEYRGGHVMQWALINGETESGVTLHYMDAGIDTGPVIARDQFAIDDADDAWSVRRRLRESGVSLLLQWWPRIADGTAPRLEQDESRAKYWPMRTPEDGRIEWSMPAQYIARLVRALASNDPGAYIVLGPDSISITRARVLPSANRHAGLGEVVGVDASGVRIAARDADVLVIDAARGGRRITHKQLLQFVARSPESIGHIP